MSDQLTPENIELLQQENVGLKEAIEEHLQTIAALKSNLDAANTRCSQLESELSTANATIEELAAAEGAAKAIVTAKGATEVEFNGKVYSIAVPAVNIPKFGKVTAQELQSNAAAMAYLVDKKSPLITEVGAAE
jgi:3-hydroxy-3-methylglutaryl CoA synthase